MPAVENGSWYRQEEVGQKVQTPKFWPGTPQQKQDGNDRSKVPLGAGDSAQTRLQSNKPETLSKSKLDLPSTMFAPGSELTSPGLEPGSRPESVKYALQLQRDQVIKVATVQSLNLANAHRLASGNKEHGHFSTGDEDGMWDNLHESQLYIQRLAVTLQSHVSGQMRSAPKEILDRKTWAIPLKALMESTALQLLGSFRSRGVLVEMKSAINHVCAVNEEYDEQDHGLLDALIKAYAHCMAILSSLWQELADLADWRSSLRDGPLRGYTLGTRWCMKTWHVRRALDSLPRRLTDDTGVLGGLLDDTLEVFATLEAMLQDKEDLSTPREEATDQRSRALAIFYRAVKRLAATDIATLKAEGVPTTYPDATWPVAAKGGLVVYMGGTPTFIGPPPDLADRMFDYVLHALAALSLLVSNSADYKEKQECLKKAGLVTADMQLRMEKAKEAASTRAFPDLDSGGPEALLDPWLRERWQAPGAQKNLEAALVDPLR